MHRVWCMLGGERGKGSADTWSSPPNHLVCAPRLSEFTIKSFYKNKVQFKQF